MTRKIFWIGVLMLFVSHLQAQKLVGYEYWLDNQTDRRVQQALQQSILQLNINVDAMATSEGLHKLSVRFKDTKDEWSRTLCRYFYRMPLAETNRMETYEYWFDNDYQSRKSGTLSTDITATDSRSIDASAFPDGLHLFAIRYKDSYQNWSRIIWRVFYKQTTDPTPALISEYRYWVGTDMSRLQSVKLITPTAEVDLTKLWQITGPSPGPRYFSFQAKDTKGAWSRVITVPFEMVLCHPEKCPTPIGTPELCQGAKQTTFITNAALKADYHEWEFLPAEAGTIVQNDLQVTIFWNANFFGQASLRARGENSCGPGEWSDPFSMTVLPIPTQPAKPVGPSQLCIAAANTNYVTQAVDYATSYLWSLTNTNSGIIVGTTTEMYIDWKDSFTGTLNLTVQGKNKCGLGLASLPLAITVSSLPAKPEVTALGPIGFCYGGSVALQAPAGKAQYLWSTGNTTQTLEVFKTGTYTVIVLDETGCFSSPSLVVNVTAYALPEKPTVVQEGPQLRSSYRDGNQWYDAQGPIPSENQKYFTPPNLGNFFVKVTDNQGCSSISDLFVYKGVGTESAESIQLTAYPNPSAGSFELMATRSLEQAQLYLIDIAGHQQTISQTHNNTRVRVTIPNPQAGSYLLVVRLPDTQYTLPIQIQ
jgi:hypothetical protein